MTRKEACYFLGIREDSSEEQIKRAYRYKAKLYHPDANPDGNTKEYYIKVQSAYEYLMNNPYVPPSNAAKTAGRDMPGGAHAAGWQGTGVNMPGNMSMNSPFGNAVGNHAYGVPPVPRQAKVYSSTASARASYQRQKDKEKERVKLQKWDEENKNSKKYQRKARFYGQEYDDSTADKSEEERRILDKIRAIWLAETIKRQIAADREHKEAASRRKLYQAFMRRQMPDGE